MSRHYKKKKNYQPFDYDQEFIQIIPAIRNKISPQNILAKNLVMLSSCVNQIYYKICF